MTEHADIEALSAFVDGEAPEWAAHVAHCPACRATVDGLRAVAAAVATPVDPPDAALRELAVTAALGDVATRHRIERERARPRGSNAAWMVAAVAAISLAIVGGTALLATADRGGGRTTAAAGRAPESGAAPTADSASPTAGPAADLGDVPDGATLLARVRPALAGTSGSAAGPGNVGNAAATGNGAQTGVAAPPVVPSSVATAPASRAAAPAPAAVGTRPCEEQARARQPSLREVVYFATARRQGVPAVVLGFSTGGDPAAVTLVLLAQDGCGELLRAAGP